MDSKLPDEKNLLLPIELQMVLCNRVFGAAKGTALTKHSEPAFKKLGRLLAKEDRH